MKIENNKIVQSKIKQENTPQKQKFSKKKRDILERKSKLAKAGRRTKWAPVWAVIKKYGMGKRIHPSAITRHRRSWRRTKLKIKPRKISKSHFG